MTDSVTDNKVNRKGTAGGLSRSQKRAMALLAMIIAVVIPVVMRVLTFAPLDELPALLDYVMEEMLPGREKIVAVDGMIDYYVFGDAGGRDVIKGKDGWFFYRNTMTDYQHTNRYSNEELEQIATNMSEINYWLAEQGIEFVLFIAPNKASVYGDTLLPSYFRKDGEVSRTEEMVQYLHENTDVNVLFPEEEMRQAAAVSRYPVYYKTDTHWNYLGGYYGTKALLDGMAGLAGSDDPEDLKDSKDSKDSKDLKDSKDSNVSKDSKDSEERIQRVSLPELREDQITEVHGPLYQWNGYDLINMMGLQYTYPEEVSYGADESGIEELAAVSYEGETAAGYNGFYDVVHTISDAADGRKLFFTRDSFGTCMMPYVAACFREVYSPHIWSGSIRQKIEEQQPDLVVLELVERDEFLNYSLESWEN